MPAFDPNVIYNELRSSFPEAQMRLWEPMSRHTTFGIGGPVCAMFLPSSEEEAVRIMDICADMGVEPLLLGNGSNLLCSDDAMDLAVIKLRGLDNITIKGTELTAGAGCLMRQAAQSAAQAGLAGMEFAHGIPGSIGGGAYMNAGAYGGEMGNIIRTVRVRRKDGSVAELSSAELEYSYRHSRFESSGETVLSVTVSLCEDEQDAIFDRMNDLWQRRRDKQPLDKPSAGSTFKRPPVGYAAAMIDQAGLKGKGVGAACVSEKHAGFVVNMGGATCSDVLATMRMVRDEVYKKFSVTLEPEVRLIGVSL